MVQASREIGGRRLRHKALLAAARGASRLSIALVSEYQLVREVEVPPTAVFIAPHRSMFDVPLGLETFRRLDVEPLVVVSRSQLRQLRVPESNWDALDLLPISRNASGRSSLLAHGGSALDSGRSVAIMPEGRISRQPGEFGHVRSGAAHLATLHSTPIVVLGSAGSEQFWQRREPFTFLNANRRPTIALVHSVISPHGSVEKVAEQVGQQLRKAEARASELLSAATRG